jgi:hypothetical protein
MGVAAADAGAVAAFLVEEFGQQARACVDGPVNARGETSKRRAAQRQRIPPPSHSITWSARARIDGGIVRPSAFNSKRRAEQ